MSDKPKFDPNQPFQAVGSKPKFDPSQPHQVVGQEEPSVLDQIGQALSNQGKVINAGVHGAANFMTGGYLPQIEAGPEAAYDTAKDVLSGTTDLGDSLGALADNYQKNKDRIVGNENKIEGQAPVAHFLGGMAGGAMLPFPQTQGATAFQRIGNAAATNGLMGYLMNPGDKKGESGDLQMAQRGKNALYGMGLGAGVHTLVGEAPTIAKKGLSTLFGPDEEAINSYLANRERINSTPNVATMKDLIDEQVRALQGAVDKGQLSVEQAKGHLKDLNNQITQVSRDAGREYSEALPEMQRGIDSYYQELGAQQQGVEGQLKGVAHPREMADDVHQAVGDLKSQVVDEAGKARDILAKSGQTIQTAPLRDQLKSAAEAQLLDGAQPVTEQGKAALARLQALDQSLSALPADLKGPAAKKLVQQLDDEVSYIREAGGFGSDYDQVIKGLRRNIDAQLKGNKDYADQMKVVSEKTGLLDKANDLFGTREKAYSAMNGIASPGKVPQRGVLGQLGEHTGNDFSTPVENFTKAQNTLKNGMEPIVENLPAQQSIAEGEALKEVASTPRAKDAYVNATLDERGLPQAKSAHEAELERLQAELGLSQEKAEPYSKWSPASTQNKIQSLVSRAPDKASIEAGRELEGLEAMRGDHGGQTYPEMIDDNRVLNQFSRDNTRGSRNTMMWRGLGGAAGAATGAVIPGSHVVTVPVGLGAGGVLGGYIDKNGGRLAKGALDHYLDNKAAYDYLTSRPAANIVNPWLQLRRKDEQ